MSEVSAAVVTWTTLRLMADVWGTHRLRRIHVVILEEGRHYVAEMLTL
ncbi:hypothetical protein L3055_07660 [Corynebacterium sp. MC-02]|nr:hypothetical protein [Corynebacterium pseudokroppenstedtii]MCF8703421.1 hypothetical protein [Corynebacterium pseudokroppenstedtii]